MREPYTLDFEKERGRGEEGGKSCHKQDTGKQFHRDNSNDLRVISGDVSRSKYNRMVNLRALRRGINKSTCGAAAQNVFTRVLDACVRDM